MQATVDGSVWRFTTANVATAVIGGGVSLGAQRLVGSNIDALNFVLSGVTATGTYALTTTPPSRFVNLQTGGGSWVGNGAGAATGSITFTTFSSARLAGIFSFTATPLGGGATGNKVVTAGTFDVAIAN